MRFCSERSGPHAVLFIVGTFSPAFPKYNKMVRKAASRCRNLKVVFLNDPSVSQLATLYRMADLFVTASLHEGFCVPVVESMAFDLPMLLPDAEVFRETSRGRARYFKRITKADLIDPPARISEATPAGESNHDFFMRHYSFAVLRGRLLGLLHPIKSG